MNTPTFRRIGTAAALLLAAVALSWGQIPSTDLERMEQAAPARATVRPEHPRKLLVFTLSQGYKHTAIERASAALQILAKKTGAFDVVFSADTAIFAPASLKQFDGICFNNTTWLTLADPVLRKSILDFATNGGGIIGIHAGVDNFYSWPEAQEMFGGYFDGHPWTGDGTWAVTIEDPTHPLMTSFHGKDFTIHDELYRIAPVSLRKNCRVLMRINSNDPHNRTANGMRPSDRDLPISWIRTYGKGRVFYCSLGHNDEIYWNPAVLQHYLDGLQYAFGDLAADATPRPFDPLIMLNADSLHVYLGRIAAYVEGNGRQSMMAFDALVRRAGNAPGVCAKIEQAMLRTLQGQVTSEGKRFLCKRLADFGTDSSVAVLSAMVTRPETFDVALYALEAIPGKTSELILLETLDRSAGAQLVAVLNAVGSRRSAVAVPRLQKLLAGADPAVATMAAASLGRIGTVPALDALKAARTTTSGPLQQSVIEGMALAADLLIVQGEKDAALRTYRSLLTADVQAPVRMRAVRGLVHGNDPGLPELVTSVLAGKDDVARTSLLEAVQQMPSGETVHSIAGMLPQLSDGEKVRLLSSLAKHPDPAIREIVTGALKEKSPDVRIAALQTLKSIGTAAAVRPMIAVAVSAKGDEQREARESLALLVAPGTDDSLVILLRGTQNDLKTEVVKAMRERRVPTSAGPLLVALQDRAPKVRQEAALALRLIAEAGDIPEMLSSLQTEKSDGTRKELENSIVATALRINDPAERDPQVIGMLSTTKDRENRMSLVRILGRIGTPQGLETIVPALKDRDKDVMMTSVRALSEWPTPAAYSHLLSLANTSTDRTVRTLAVRGVVRTTGLDTSLTHDGTLGRYREAFALTKDADERKQLLALVGAAPSLAAFDMAAECMNETVLKADAEVTLVTIGEAIVRHDGKAIAPQFEQLRTSSNPAVREKALDLLAHIARMSGNR
jgi:type 1 glutamine amidotransferase/HEAT repeat protein